MKTRLAAWIGADAAVEFYRAFVADVLATVKISGFPFQICFYPEDKRALMLKWLGEEHHYMPQRGKNLGERMKGGFVDTFASGNKQIVITGSDENPDKQHGSPPAGFHGFFRWFVAVINVSKT